MKPTGRLPLVRRIYDGEQPILVVGGRHQSAPSILKLLERSVFFDVQVAKDLMDARIEGQGGETVIYSPRGDFGPLRPSRHVAGVGRSGA